MTGALSIAQAQIFLALFLIGMSFSLVNQEQFVFRGFKEQIRQTVGREREILSIFYFPCFVWMGTLFLSSIVGLRPMHSLVSLLKLLPYLAIPFFVLSYFRMETDFKADLLWEKVKKFLILLFIGQSLAALHTVLSSRLGFELSPRTPGPLTESGQISLLFPLYITLVFYLFKTEKIFSLPYYVVTFLFTVMLSAISWSPYLPIPEFIKVAASVVFGLLILYLIIKGGRSVSGNETFYISLFGAFMLTALLVNLKRGPWISVVISAFAFSYLFSFKRSLSVLALIGAACFLPPVWNRLADFSEHFFIGGGRFDMWKLGFELIERFPLGIGYSNSELIREFDPSLPILHRHMHNNILNLTLENGILGGLIYVWWFYTFLFGSLKLIMRHGGSLIEKGSQLRLLAFAIFLATVGLQVAGIVEYNFGDGEIRLLFLVLSGFLLSLLSSFSSQKSDT